MTNDIILVTIDALRYDTTDRLSTVTSQFQDGIQGEAITAGAATNWVFPAVLSGSYYTNVYDTDGFVHNDVSSLPDLLGDNGYSTGAFLGFNPYLSKWRDRFDEFWNGGLSGQDEEWYSNSLKKWLNRGYRTALLQKRVPAADVLDRAEQWYRQESGPRFLWVHLMEPHKPYYPGLRHGTDVGFFESYRSILSYQRNGDETPAQHMKTQRRLYEKCVEKVDTELATLFEFISDDATVVTIGDHGDEFDHGHYGHERLYDECVRVPFFAKNIGERDVSEPVRQIDVPGTLLDQAGVSIPEHWDGDRLEAGRTAYMMTPRPSTDTFQCTVRTPSEKLIRTYDRTDGTVVRNEYYQLDHDEDEMNNQYETLDVTDLETKLEEFMAGHEDALAMDLKVGHSSDIVEERLEHLGYK